MIEIIDNISSIYELEHDWNKLSRFKKTPLLGFDWFISCLETIHSNSNVKIVLVRNNSSITAIAPLYINRTNYLSTLEFIGASTLYEPAGLLYTDKESLIKLINGILKLKLPLILDRLADDPVLDSVINNFSFIKAFSYKKKTSTSYFLEIDCDWDTFLSKLSSNRRYDFKRKWKRLEKKGEIRLEFFNPQLEKLDKYLDVAFEIEHKSWKGRNKSSLLANKSLQAFFRKYTEISCKNNELRMCFMYVDNHPVSMHIASVAHDCFWVLKLGYDENYAECSPGKLLAMETIKYSFNLNLKRYEFLGSEEEWQTSWPVQLHQYYTILLFPYSVRGFFELFRTFVDIAFSRIKKIGGK